MTGGDDAELDDLLTELENLTDEEAEQLLGFELTRARAADA